MLLALAAAVIVSGQSFSCTPIRVWDGDGPIWCAEGPKIRLAGIAAREIDGTCKPGHPCPKASGIEARDRLVRYLGGAKGEARTGHVLVAAPAMRCVSNGPAHGDRTGAWCDLPGVGNLNCAMSRTGVVLRWDRYAGKRCRS
ncbi:hypothetical protein WG908_06335 [Sphingobium sp. AN641]|uniref:thermonuclease family protein n=1 Tax=Sphingobium sp. AN641 TaxID=3133443 RepID=UPI0030C0F552